MATSKASDLTLGNFLKIVSKGAVYNNLSEDSPIWDNVSKYKKGAAEGRQLQYLVQSSYGAGAVGFLPVDGGDYFSAHKAATDEAVAQYKDFALTVEVERTLIAKAMSDFSSYGKPLANELRSKSIALSRELSASLYRDGTGVLGSVASVTDLGANLRITLKTGDTDRGHIGWFNYGDKLFVTDAAGAVETGTGITQSASQYFVVVDRDRDNNTVTIAANDGTALSAGTIDATSLIYRVNQGTRPDLSSAPATDYNTLSEEWAGLESLSQADGRIVNALTHSGALAGTRRDAGGNPIDSQDFQQLMSKLMTQVGAGRYKYSKAMMSWETMDALIESREVDRRFQSIKDNKRGVESLGYQHGKNSIMFEADEFCPKKRIYVLPDADVLQFHGSDFEFVKAEGGPKFHLKASANGGYSRAVQAFMEGSGVFISTHNAAIGCIHNFV